MLEENYFIPIIRPNLASSTARSARRSPKAQS